MDFEEMEFYEATEKTTNVLGLVMFSIVLGIAFGAMGDKAKPLCSLIETFSEAMMRITSWVIW